MKRTIMAALAGLAAIAAGVSGAAAQTEQDFINAFAGQWQALDARYVDGGTGACSLMLKPEQAPAGNYQMENSGCGASLALVASWGITDGQMALYGADGTAIARLGGNQRRMSGNSASGEPLILDRVGVSGTADLLQAAVRASGCFYSGFTSSCAPANEIGKPAAETPSLKVLVNLNVRNEARDDAAILGIIPASSCITAEVCLNAADGPWCRAQFDGKTGWFRKLALRQNRWPVVTFFNACE